MNQLNIQDVFNKSTFRKIGENIKSNLGSIITSLIVIMICIVIFVVDREMIQNIPKRVLFVLCLLTVLICVVGKKLYNKVFVGIVLMGGFFSFITPNMDVPDEPAHFARTLYIADGNLFFPKDRFETYIDSSFQQILDEYRAPLIESEIRESSFSGKTSIFHHAGRTDAQLFITYLPSVIGVWIAKLLGGNLAVTVFLGRFLNVLVYALLSRYAVKKAGEWGALFSVASLFPMAVWISASFSRDSMLFGLFFVILAMFIDFIYRERKINKQDVLAYSILCALVAVTKLPYAVAIGLLIFISRKRYESAKTYYLSFALVGIVLIIGLLWTRIVATGTNEIFVYSEINPIEKIKYMLSNKSHLVKFFLEEFSVLIPNMINSAFTFGWLSYGVSWIGALYLIFIGAVTVMYPIKLPLPMKSRIGVILVLFGTVLGFMLTAFLLWNKVTDYSLAGIQGRYFIGCIILSGLSFNLYSLFIEHDKDSTVSISSKGDKYLFTISLLFILVMAVKTVMEYYAR